MTPLTNTQILQRIEGAQGLWVVFLPTIPQPEARQFWLWANRFTDTQIERAFSRAGRKFSRSADPEEIGRYVTGVLLNLQREQSASPQQDSLMTV